MDEKLKSDIMAIAMLLLVLFMGIIIGLVNYEPWIGPICPLIVEYDYNKGYIDGAKYEIAQCREKVNRLITDYDVNIPRGSVVSPDENYSAPLQEGGN